MVFFHFVENKSQVAEFDTSAQHILLVFVSVMTFKKSLFISFGACLHM